MNDEDAAEITKRITTGDGVSVAYVAERYNMSQRDARAYLRAAGARPDGSGEPMRWKLPCPGNRDAADRRLNHSTDPERWR